MKICRQQWVAAVALVAAWPAAGLGPAPDRGATASGLAALGLERSPSDALVAAIEEPALASLAAEAVESSPGVAAATARARAAALRAPQVVALPDPMVSWTAFLAPPETRAGPQRLSAGVQQGLPWRGKRGLERQAAERAAEALAAEVEVAKLAVVTKVRRLFHELAFLDRRREITREYRAHLVQHEEIARGRYSTGVGLGQGVIKLQAQITLVDRELLEIDRRQATLGAELNALRGGPALAPLPAGRLGPVSEARIDFEGLLATALAARPELAAARARIAHAEAMERLAEKNRRPELRVGLVWTAVEPRDDAPGRLMPPPDNGDDIFGVVGGFSLPVRRQKLAAAVEEAAALSVAAAEERRRALVEIESRLGELAQRLPLDWRRLRLVEDLLLAQAEEALESAQAGYVAGTLNALDLLDAEHVLFDARTARARAKADYLIGLAELEGALGAPLPRAPDSEGSES